MIAKINQKKEKHLQTKRRNSNKTTFTPSRTRTGSDAPKHFDDKKRFGDRKPKVTSGLSGGDYPSRDEQKQIISAKIEYVQTSPRHIVERIYAKWQVKLDRIEPYAAKALQRNNWDKRDKALFIELLYGVIRRHGYLQWVLDYCSDRKTESLKEVNAAACVGCYQLLFSDKIPAYAAVDEAVESARKYGGEKTSGWVNAVLRRVAAKVEANEAIAPNGKDAYNNLAITHSHPYWLVVRWNKIFGGEKLVNILEWNNRRPSVIVRTNITKISPKELMTFFQESEIIARLSSFDPQYLVLERPHLDETQLMFRNGWISVQDHTQGIAVRSVKIKDGETILDLCSAPGGKTGHLAELYPHHRIIATDKSEERLLRVNDLVKRNEYHNVEVKGFNDLIASKEKFDVILIDAPCTGTGVMARRPDLRWRIKPMDIPRMANVQMQLLHYAVERLNKGGRIIYSTCSIEPEENEQVVDRIRQESRLVVHPIEDNLLKGRCSDDGSIRVVGDEIGGDGVYVVVLARN